MSEASPEPWAGLLATPTALVAREPPGAQHVLVALGQPVSEALCEMWLSSDFLRPTTFAHSLGRLARTQRLL